MRRSPFRFVAALLAAGALLLTACGSSSGDASSTDTAGGAPTGGAVAVCSDIPYKPFEFEVDGKTTGFDYDVVTAVAATFNQTADFRTTPFDTIIPSLVAGDCKMIASAMTITPERAEQVNFTDPYFDADQSLLVLTTNAETYKTLDDLAGKTIGVQSGTSGADFAEANKPAGATIKEFQTGEDAFPALLSGDVDAVLQDYPVNAYRATQEPDTFVVTEKFPTGEQYGFAVPKDNAELLADLNAGLATIKANGTYDRIFAQWFGQS